MLRNDRTRASIIVCSLLVALTAGSAPAAPGCHDAHETSPNGIHHGFSPTEEFRLRLPAAGVLSVDLTTGRRPGEDAAGRIEIAPGACGERPADVLFVERSATRLVLAARAPGTLRLRTVTTAPYFQLVTRFTEARVVVEDFDLDGAPVRQTSFVAEELAAKTDPEDVDPDPDGLRAGGGRLLASFLTLEISREQKAAPEDVDPDPDGLTVQATSPD